MPQVRNRFTVTVAAMFGTSPTARRLAWHARRSGGSLDRRFLAALIQGGAAIVVAAALLVTVLEKPWRDGLGPAMRAFGNSLNRAFFTVLGQGDSSYEDHVIVCGWNATARDLVEELHGDEYPAKVVILAELEKSPASGACFVRGDTTNTDNLKRAGIEDAAAALVFPTGPTNDTDMHSILTLMAIHAAAPKVRTVAEVNSPRHVEHFQRANVDEALLTSRLAPRLLARSALYPGLSGLLADIVSGGEGSELYRVDLPDDLCGLSVDEVSARLRSDHRATLLAISRHGETFTNPPTDYKLQPCDDALVVAESLKTLTPLRADRAVPASRS